MHLVACYSYPEEERRHLIPVWSRVFHPAGMLEALGGFRDQLSWVARRRFTFPGQTTSRFAPDSGAAGRKLGNVISDSELACRSLRGLNSDSELASPSLRVVISDSEMTRGSEVSPWQ